jgi:hypothetical protein
MKRVVMLLSSTIVIGLLSACGGSDDNASAPPAAATAIDVEAMDSFVAKSVEELATSSDLIVRGTVARVDPVESSATVRPRLRCTQTS